MQGALKAEIVIAARRCGIGAARVAFSDKLE